MTFWVVGTAEPMLRTNNLLVSLSSGILLFLLTIEVIHPNVDDPFDVSTVKEF
jgi:hypothetical protein